MSDLSDFKSALVRVARGELGVRESGRNSGERVRAYQSTTWLEPGSWPWCAAFVCWVVRVAALRHPLPFPLPDTPRAVELATKWAKGRTSLVKNPSLVVPGDIVVFRFDSGHHCGIVSVGSGESGMFKCVEGNTDGSGGRDGDGVYERTRKLGVQVIYAIRF